MIGIYFSGTGNTKHCVEKLISLLDASAQCFPIEYVEVEDVIAKHDSLVLGYPTSFPMHRLWCVILLTNTAHCGTGKRFLYSIPWDCSAVTEPDVPRDF